MWGIVIIQSILRYQEKLTFKYKLSFVEIKFNYLYVLGCSQKFEK